MTALLAHPRRQMMRSIPAWGLATGAIALLCSATAATTATPVRAAASTLPAIAETEVAEAIPTTARLLYVDANSGIDSSISGSQAEPFRTIRYALSQASAGDTIQLAPGTYSAESGEVFPLRLPEGVTLRGDEAAEGKNTHIVGGNLFISPSFARQNAAIVVDRPDIAISGIAVTNPNTRGTGLWIESGSPIVRYSVFQNNHRDGIFITGSATPSIHNCLFYLNKGNGLSIARSAGGEIRDNWFQSTGFGLAIGGSSAPVLLNNHVVNNRDGLVLTGRARPVLRGNTIENNQRDGIVAIAQTHPDLGTASDPGYNKIRSNGRYNLHNITRNVFAAVGNEFGATGRVIGQARLH